MRILVVLGLSLIGGGCSLQYEYEGGILVWGPVGVRTLRTVDTQSNRVGRLVSVRGLGVSFSATGARKGIGIGYVNDWRVDVYAYEEDGEAQILEWMREGDPGNACARTARASFVPLWPRALASPPRVRSGARPRQHVAIGLSANRLETGWTVGAPFIDTRWTMGLGSDPPVAYAISKDRMSLELIPFSPLSVPQSDRCSRKGASEASGMRKRGR